MKEKAIFGVVVCDDIEEVQSFRAESGILPRKTHDTVVRAVNWAKRNYRKGTPVSGLMFSAGHRFPEFRGTYAEHMREFAFRLLEPMVKEKLMNMPPLFVNHNLTVWRLDAQLGWAYEEARRRNDNPKLKVIATGLTRFTLLLENLTGPRIFDCSLAEEEEEYLA